MDEFLDSTHNPPTWKSILKSRVPINNQHQVMFLTYRINNLTVQSVIYFWSYIHYQPEKGYVRVLEENFIFCTPGTQILQVVAGYIIWKVIDHSLIYEHDMFVFEHNEFMLFTTHKSEAYNTNTYFSFFLLHAVVRWKGLVDRVRVPCVMCRLPPGVEHGTKLGDLLCWDFALLVAMGCWILLL